jgi:hypothetical protein
MAAPSMSMHIPMSFPGTSMISSKSGVALPHMSILMEAINSASISSTEPSSSSASASMSASTSPSLTSPDSSLISDPGAGTGSKRRLDGTAKASSSISAGRRVPLCSRCSNHGVKLAKKNHLQFCEFRYCPCFKCEDVAKRQDVMAQQISRRRAERNASASSSTLTAPAPKG